MTGVMRLIRVAIQLQLLLQAMELVGHQLDIDFVVVVPAVNRFARIKVDPMKLL